MKELGEVDGPTVIIGLLSLAMVLGVKRWLPLVPGSLLVVLLGIDVYPTVLQALAGGGGTSA